MTDTMTADTADIAAEIAQTEKIGLGDFVIAAVLAALTFCGLTAWEYPGLSPSLWDDIAVAAGVRPAAHVMPGYFTAIAGFIYSAIGLDAGNVLLRLVGHISLACIAVIVYAAMREMLAFIMRARPQRSKRRSFVMQVSSFIGTAAFIMTDPVWAAGQCLSETTILTILTLCAIEFFFLFLRKGSIRWAYVCAAFLGLLCAESPMGFVFLAAFIVLNFVVLRVMPVLESPFFRPEVIAVGKWYMTFIFLVSMIFGIVFNCWSFAAHGGLAAVGKTIGNLPLDYVLAYWGRTTSAADLTGAIMLLGACLMPFVVTIVRFPAAADEEVFLSYSTGMVFLFCGLVAFLQSAPIPELWFWTYGVAKSSYLLVVGILLAATTVAGAVTIFGVDSLCRNHLRLAQQQFGVEDDDEDSVAPPVSSRLSTLIRRTGMVMVPLTLFSVMFIGRAKPATRAMLSLVDAVVDEMVEEAGDADYMFTDGNLDAAIELESARRGGSLKCLSMMGGSSPYAVHLRTRGLLNDKEDKFSFEFDSAMGLRSWIRDRPAKLAKCAIQLGYDLWKRDGKPIPPVGGVISRPTGWADDSVRAEGVTRAHALAERALAIISNKGGLKDCTERGIRTAFSSVMWRLSRACTYRGERLDLAGDAKGAIAEAELAARLNDNNETYKAMQASIRKQSDRMQQQLTTREGLQLALVRADFNMGKLYAETILAAEPDNPDANFAMGMYYQQARQLTRAEEYLKRCLIRKPKEPAIYNNLAMVQMELGKLDVAEKNAQKALAIIPDAAAVKDTLKSIKEAREARAKGTEKDGRK